ncbi:hypothetical protein [Stenotrophomonas sp.]|uniref:hypothetical protein n=1 Tax=Stenotrophomonas sp. TaxID=69392 RepID=UPI0028A20592|nr:hypothetical protein [Stenotrophomonas sp.]
MNTGGYRRTMRGVIQGHRFLLTVTSQIDDVFPYSAVVDGVAAELRIEGVIRNRGDALQLGMAAVERHIFGLPPKG